MGNNRSKDNDYRDWAGLPIELSTLILTHIYSDTDVNQFRRVCKSWCSVSDPRFPSEWLLIHKDDVLELIHPFSMDKYSIHIPKRFRNAILLHSNNGWLLFRGENGVIFFLNPFTKESINVPGSLDLRDCKIVTFLSYPTCSDCMVVGFNSARKSKEELLHLNLVRSSPNKWKSLGWYLYSYDFPFKDACHPTCNVVYHNDLLCTLTNEGDIAVIDEGKKRIIQQVSNRPPKELCRECYLVECEGQLVAVFLSVLGEDISILRLDEAKMEWCTVDDLGDMLLFVSCTSSYAMKRVKEGTKNKIYFPRSYQGRVVFYCLATRSYKTFDNFFHYSLENTEEHIECAWIQPNTHRAIA